MQEEAAAFYASLDEQGVKKRHTHVLQGDEIHTYMQFLTEQTSDSARKGGAETEHSQGLVNSSWPQWRTALHCSIKGSREEYGVLQYRDEQLIGVAGELEEAREDLVRMRERLLSSAARE